jgi:hypothetical protein
MREREKETVGETEPADMDLLIFHCRKTRSFLPYEAPEPEQNSKMEQELDPTLRLFWEAHT